MKTVGTITAVFATYVLLAITTAQFAGAAPIDVDFPGVVDKPLDAPIIPEEGFASQDRVVLSSGAAASSAIGRSTKTTLRRNPRMK
ncbi:unnamed protein product [Tilletia controversa]|nr:unnamed protein product [Tilletia controversa]CAD6953094.1 unnamed protein product [Tilletia controversa]CAD6956391.1 unnamed protein product [Tilletia controversa]